MRLLGSVVGTALLFAGSAEAHCPATADEALASLGPNFSTAAQTQSVWFTPRTTMLGRDVPYVVVQLHEGRVSSLFYRLNGQATQFDRNAAVWPDRIAPDLERRFQILYPDSADCAVPSCIATDFPYGFGLLQDVVLAPAWHDVSDDWGGPALAQLRTDQAALDAVSRTAVFLSCTYNLTVSSW